MTRGGENMLIVSSRLDGWAINLDNVVSIEPMPEGILFFVVNSGNDEKDGLMMYCNDPYGVFEQILESYARGDSIFRIPEFEG